jgi:hypothetical protein
MKTIFVLSIFTIFLTGCVAYPAGYTSYPTYYDYQSTPAYVAPSISIIPPPVYIGPSYRGGYYGGYRGGYYRRYR